MRFRRFAVLWAGLAACNATPNENVAPRADLVASVTLDVMPASGGRTTWTVGADGHIRGEHAQTSTYTHTLEGTVPDEVLQPLLANAAAVWTQPPTVPVAPGEAGAVTLSITPVNGEVLRIPWSMGTHHPDPRVDQLESSFLDVTAAING